MHQQKVSRKDAISSGEMGKVWSNLITAKETKVHTLHTKNTLILFSKSPSTLLLIFLIRETQKEAAGFVLFFFFLFVQSLTEEQRENCHSGAGDAMKHFAPPRDRNRMKINTVFVARQIVFDIWRSAMQDNYSKWHWPTLTYHYNSRSTGGEWEHLNGMELFVLEVEIMAESGWMWKNNIFCIPVL